MIELSLPSLSVVPFMIRFAVKGIIDPRTSSFMGVVTLSSTVKATFFFIWEDSFLRRWRTDFSPCTLSDRLATFLLFLGFALAGVNWLEGVLLPFVEAEGFCSFDDMMSRCWWDVGGRVRQWPVQDGNSKNGWGGWGGWG